MSDTPLDQQNLPEEAKPEILVNDYGETRDPAVVVDSPERTVLLTEDEAIVIEKETRIEIVPANRPRKVYSGMWGQAELVTIGLAMLAVLTVVLIYLFLVVPANSELQRNLAERDRVKAELASNQEKYGGISNTQTHVATLMSSVDNFEAQYLPIAVTGRTSLYQRLNGLIATHGLVNTTGPDYSPLETIEQGSGVETEEERGRSKYRSLFPGVYVTMTVEGPYQNVRRFIREVETGNDFVVVSSVEIEPSDAERKADQPGEQQNPAAQPGGGPNAGPNFSPGLQNAPLGGQPTQAARNRGKMHGEVVSLRLEMAAYFRRNNSVPQVAAPVEQQ